MKYSNAELCAMVDEFRTFAAEPSWLEFKAGMKDPVQIAKYISGLSNVAAYAGNTHGYLVWGVNDETHEVETSDFDPDVVKAEKNQPLRLWLKLVLKPQIEFEFYPFEYDGRKGVLLEVEAAYRQPVTFRGVGYVRIGSALTELSKEPKIAASIYRTLGHDWSADIVHGAGNEDLDPAAIAYARELFADRHKLTKIGNLLSLKLKKRLGWIVSDGSTSGAYWSLTNKGREACRKGSPSCKKRCAKL